MHNLRIGDVQASNWQCCNNMRSCNLGSCKIIILGVNFWWGLAEFKHFGGWKPSRVQFGLILKYVSIILPCKLIKTTNNVSWLFTDFADLPISIHLHCRHNLQKYSTYVKWCNSYNSGGDIKFSKFSNVEEVIINN